MLGVRNRAACLAGAARLSFRVRTPGDLDAIEQEFVRRECDIERVSGALAGMGDAADHSRSKRSTKARTSMRSRTTTYCDVGSPQTSGPTTAWSP